MDKEQLKELFATHKDYLMQLAITELKLYDWKYVLQWDCAEFVLLAEQWVNYHTLDAYYLIVELLTHYGRLHTPKIILESDTPWVKEIENAANFLITRLKQCLVIKGK